MSQGYAILGGFGFVGFVKAFCVVFSIILLISTNKSFNTTPTAMATTRSNITVSKQDIADDDFFGFEMFECYLDDGNEVIQVGFVLFSIDPNQVTAESIITEGAPNITLVNTEEELVNRLLQDNMEQLLDEKAAANITLSADIQQSLAADEQAAVEQAIGENGQIELCLDLNLYKEIQDTTTEITETAKEIALSVGDASYTLNLDPACFDGDANGDGSIDIKDIVRTKKAIAGSANATDDADINGDGKIVAADLTLLAKYIITAKTGMLTHTVTFKDSDGTVLEELAVPSGFKAVPGIIPTEDKNGNIFDRRDRSLSNISSNTIITAVYGNNVSGSVPEDWPYDGEN